MSILNLRSRLHGIDNDAKNIVFQGIRNGQTVTLNDAFEIDKYVRNLKRNDAWKNISFFRDFASVPNLNPVGGPRITFARASGATRVNQQGLVELMGTNVPRFDYDPITRAGRGLLIEESRTNNLLRSEEFDNASWTKSNSSISANVTLSPDGTLTADKLMDTVSNSVHGVIQSFTAVNATIYSGSIFAKASERNWIYLTWGGTMGATGAYVNLTDGSSGTIDAGVTLTVNNFGNGWYRINITKTAPGSGSSNLSVFTASGNNGVTYIGDGASGVFIWGAQLETGSFPTSYIPTTSATVTRSADIANIIGNDFSALYKNSEGSLLIEENKNSNNVPISINNGTLTERLHFAGNALRGFIQTASLGTSFIGSGSTPLLNTIFKEAIAYAYSDYAYCNTGASTQTGSYAALISANRIEIGNVVNASQYSGYIRKIVYFSKRLSNTVLQSLTS